MTPNGRRPEAGQARMREPPASSIARPGQTEQRPQAHEQLPRDCSGVDNVDEASDNMGEEISSDPMDLDEMVEFDDVGGSDSLKTEGWTRLSGIEHTESIISDDMGSKQEEMDA
ncbi:hypothetical protein TKK_0014781 [Trichogramma kaykai]